MTDFSQADPNTVQAIMLAQKASEMELSAIRDRGHRFASATPIDTHVPPVEGDYWTVIHGHRTRAEDLRSGLTSTHFGMVFEGGSSGEFARGMISEGLSFVPTKYWDGEFTAKHLIDNVKWGVLLVLPPGTPIEPRVFVHAVWIGILDGADVLATALTKKEPGGFRSNLASISKYLRLLSDALPNEDPRSVRYRKAARRADEISDEAELDARPTTYRKN